jgi:hypothetical protein
MPHYAMDFDEGEFVENPYIEIREILAPPYHKLPSKDIEQMLERADISAEDLENFLGTLKDIGRGVVNVLPQVLPGAIQGATAGAALGPWGALGGALLGGLGGALGGGQRPGQPTPPPQVAPQMPLPQMPGTPPAAAQLLTTMFHPQVLQALMAMLLGQIGRQNIPVGATQVPVGAFTNALGVMANQAATEYNAAVTASGGNVPAYLVGFAGEVSGDPALPEYRAARLMELLQEADREQYRPDSEDVFRRYAHAEDAPDISDEIYDELELAELYSDYETW